MLNQEYLSQRNLRRRTNTVQVTNHYQGILLSKGIVATHKNSDGIRLGLRSISKSMGQKRQDLNIQEQMHEYIYS